jgi:phosphate/sulfate permease
MLATLVPGMIAIALACGLVAPVVIKVQSTPLWIVVAIGIGLMVATLVEGVRQERHRD